MKKNFHRYIVLTVRYYCYSTVLSGNKWQELEPESKLLTKVEPEPKIEKFWSATLQYMQYRYT